MAAPLPRRAAGPSESAAADTEDLEGTKFPRQGWQQDKQVEMDVDFEEVATVIGSAAGPATVH